MARLKPLSFKASHAVTDEYFEREQACSRLLLVLAKHYGGELEDVGVFVFPAIRVHARLDAGLLKKWLPVPFLFQRDLREQQAFGVAILHQQAVAANPDLFNISDAAQGREHGGSEEHTS